MKARREIRGENTLDWLVSLLWGPAIVICVLTFGSGWLFGSSLAVCVAIFFGYLVVRRQRQPRSVDDSEAA